MWNSAAETVEMDYYCYLVVHDVQVDVEPPATFAIPRFFHSSFCINPLQELDLCIELIIKNMGHTVTFYIQGSLCLPVCKAPSYSHFSASMTNTRASSPGIHLQTIKQSPSQ